MNLFAESDRRKLVAPPSLFNRETLRDKHGDWGHQLLRAATAIEMLSQITTRDLTVLLKGGTLLQHSLAWPPYRASVDLDLEVTDAGALEAVLRQIEDSFSDSDVHVSIQNTQLSGFTGRVSFPRSSGPDWVLRIDALENDRWPSGSSPWQAISAPWEDATRPQVASVEARAAQKILLSADPPYGRDFADHHGRQNFVKDLFDLHCLGQKPLQAQRLLDAAREDVERKSDYLDEQYHLEDLLDQCTESLRQLAHPPVDDDSVRGSIWRAYDRVKNGIRIPFTRASLRISAGCAHHALEGIRHEELDWQDTRRPATDQSPRFAWEERPIQPVIEVEDDYGVTVGVREAWAQFSDG